MQEPNGARSEVPPKVHSGHSAAPLPEGKADTLSTIRDCRLFRSRSLPYLTTYIL
jgi:hypothetical protein